MVFAGGLAKRMGMEKPKALIEVGGQLLIDRCLNFYLNCGFTDFVFLLGYGQEEVRGHIGDGNRYGIRANFSEDPATSNVGKGKALRHAIDLGKIDLRKRAIVAFPDDIFTDESLPVRVLLEHLYGVRTFGITTSTVLTRGMKWSYGVAELNKDGLVTRFEEKPFVQLLTSVGVYIFEPPTYAAARELLDMSCQDPVEFEKSLLPELARRGQVYSILIPSECWLPINTQKDREEAEKVLAQRTRSPANWAKVPTIPATSKERLHSA